MSVALAIWSTVITPGEEPEVVVPISDLRITNVALSDILQDDKGRTTLKLSHSNLNDDSENEDENEEDAGPTLSTTVITSLTPGKIEQSTVDITLFEGQEYLFEVVGQNSIHLTGNYIAGRGDMDDMSDLDSEEEDAYDLREVSSDVEIDPAEIDSDASRFEDVEEEQPKESAKSTKRPRDSDADTEAKPAKSDKKKNKKLKAENGEAVATGTDDKNGDAEKKDKKKKDKKAKGEAKAANDSQKSESKELPGGLKVRDAKVGSGPMAKPGNRLKMRYIGKLQNGKVFDENTKGTPFSFRLGAGSVIKGWDQGLVGMQVGGERVLVVPAQLAYGKKGTDGIPPNATLTFECKLLEIK